MTLIAKPSRRRKIALAVVLFSGMLLGVHLLLPYVVNTKRVQRMLVARASKAYGGSIEFSTFKPALLPWPHVRVTRARFFDGKRIALQIPEAAIYMKIWPLLAGRLRVHRITLIKPLWRVDLGSFDTPAAGKAKSASIDASRPGILLPFIAFLGSAEARIVNGRFDLHRDGRSVVQITELTTRIAASDRRIRLKLQGRSNLSGDLACEAELDLDSLNGHGRLNVAGLQYQRLPAIGRIRPINDYFQTAVDLKADIRTFGLERFQSRFSAKTPQIIVGQEAHRATIESISMSGRAEWDARHIGIAVSTLQSAAPKMNWSGSFSWNRDRSLGHAPIQFFLKGSDLEISPIRDRLLTLFKGQSKLEQVLDIVREGKIPALALKLSASDWMELKGMQHLHAEGDLTGGRIVVPNDLFDLEQVSGHLVVAGGRLTADGISARQGDAFANQGELVIGLYDGSRVFSLDTLIDADAAEIPKHMRKLVRSGAVLTHLERLPGVTGRASGRLMVGDHLGRLSVKVMAKARIDTGETALDLVGDFEIPPDQASSAHFFIKGRMGAAISDWLLRLGKATPAIAPKTPLMVSGVDIALAPSGRIRLSGDFEWDDGARIGVVVTSSGDDFHLQQLRIRDAVSDARISFHRMRSGRALDLRFSGRLQTSSLVRLVDDQRLRSGSVQGRCRMHIDRENRGASFLNGVLFVRDLAYYPDEAGVIHIIEGSISGQKGRFDLPSALFTWDGSTIALSARGLFTPQGIDLNGTLQADTLHTQKIMTVFGAGPDQTSSKESRADGPALPLGGRLSVAVDSLIHGRYRFSAVQAFVEVRDRRTEIEVVSADLCGIQMPGQIQVSDGMTRLEFAPHAQGSSLKETGSCVADRQNSEKLMGTLNLNGRFTTQGGSREALLANLKGVLNLTVEKGRISNVGSAGVFTNLLSYLSVNQYVQGDLPDLRKDDFVYNRINSRCVFDNGAMRIEEGVLKSNAVNMVAEGRYDLLSKELDLVVLVSPLTTVDWIVEHIPIVGNILQGTLVAIPVRVKGPGADPDILPLSPKAVGARLGGILKRTFKAPVRIIEPLLKDNAGQSRKNSDN
ncbi:MAG: AsmA-like C-terminal region-containing protein [Desulfobacteraceae bacterium]